MKKKAFYQPKFYLLVNLITFFATIEDLFNHLKDIFGNFYQKEYVIKKFRELKMEASLFIEFYSKFI